MITTTMKFSFIIPTLNEEKYIQRCLGAIYAQSEPAHEIIVVDNGSKDKTVSIARKMGVKVVKESKRGQSYAKNKGAKIATGDILCFVDADQVINFDWIKRAKKQFQKKKVQAVVGVDVFKHKSPVKTFWYNAYTVFAYGTSALSGALVSKPYLACRNMAIKRKIFEKLGGWENTVGEDYWLSKKFWKLPEKKALVSLGMISYISPRGFEAEGYLKTLTYWAKATLKKESQKGYSYKSKKLIFDR